MAGRPCRTRRAGRRRCRSDLRSGTAEDRSGRSSTGRWPCPSTAPAASAARRPAARRASAARSLGTCWRRRRSARRTAAIEAPARARAPKIMSPPGVDALHNPTVGHTIDRVIPALRRTCGRTVAKSVNSSGSISASGALHASMRWRTLLLAASPASFHPVNAAMMVGLCKVGSANQRT